MEETCKTFCEISFNILDFQKKNRYNLIKLETLMKEPIKIEKEKMKIKIKLDENNILDECFNENIYLLSSTKELPEKKFICTIFCSIENIINLNINEEGDCSLEITSMWDINYEDSNCFEERKINDIEYNGKKIANFEKLYERKRWTVLNAEIEKFEAGLFSQETLEHIKMNSNKSYKYDILISKDNKTKLLSEKNSEIKPKYLEEKEKESLKTEIETLKTHLISLIKKMEADMSDAKQVFSIKKQLINFWTNNRSKYSSLDETFKIYNKKWNLNEFSESDFNLFLSFSELQIYFKNYTLKEVIPVDFRLKTEPIYNKLKKDVIENNSLNLIEKTRIICSFSKFCSTSLIDFIFPELVFVDKLGEDESFKMAISKYKDVLNKLTEKSGLFKQLLLFDMGSTKIINEWDLTDFKVINLKYHGSVVESSEEAFQMFKVQFNKIKKKELPNYKGCENCAKLTYPVLSMLTLENIKSHSLNLLPKYFFKVPFVYDFNALSISSYRIIFFNMDKVLQKKDFEKKKNNISPKACVLPLMIEISHESLSHLKVRYSSMNCESPILNPIKGNRKLLCPNNYNTESGYVFEYLLTSDNDELQFLRYPNKNLFPLTNSEYWTDINFNKMKEFLREEMKLMQEDNIQFQEDFENMAFYYNKKAIDKDEVIRCAFKKFNL